MIGLLRTFLMLLLMLVLVRALLRFFGGVVQGMSQPGRPAEPHRPASPPPTKMVQDPICGTYVVPGKALEFVHSGQTRFFCSESCRRKFLEKA